MNLFKLSSKYLDSGFEAVEAEVPFLSSSELEGFFFLLVKQEDFNSLLKCYNSTALKKHSLPFIVLLLEQHRAFHKIKPLEINKILSDLETEGVFKLHNRKNNLPESFKKKVEQAVIKREEEIEAFKKELEEEIQFLESQMLKEKAAEFKKRYLLFFPEPKANSEVTQKPVEPSPTLNPTLTETRDFAKIIERNLSFEVRSNQRRKSESADIANKDQEKLLGLAKIWESEFSKNLDLYLEQVEFLDLDSEEFYKELLKRYSFDFWTTLNLYLKSKQYLLGLNYIESNPSYAQSSNSLDTYNYYYLKALFYYKLGMNEEADKIFKAILEQNENFRDVKILFKG